MIATHPARSTSRFPLPRATHQAHETTAPPEQLPSELFPLAERRDFLVRLGAHPAPPTLGQPAPEHPSTRADSFQ